DIDVDKTGPAEAHEGDTITYTIVVTNTGDCTLYDVYLNDTSLSWSIGHITLAVNESKTYYVNYTITGSEGDPFTNTVLTGGTDNLGETVTDEDSHTVDILHPDIDVDKTGPAEAHEGDTITYTIVVTNTGDCPLYNVYVNDTQLGWSTGPTTLAINESKTYYVNYTIIGSEGDPFNNTAYAEGTDNLGETVTDSDSHTVDILHPVINVTKTADRTYAYWGDSINYTFTVSNDGDCILYNVSVIDTIFGDLTSHLDDTTLDIGETNTFTITYVVPMGSEDIVNVVTASGTDNLGKTVTDSDGWTVIVIGLPKSAVTDSNLCYFDRNEELDGAQFRLIFTQDPTNPGTYKLTASNPGQFYYNVFFIGTPGDEVILDITIPYPFITHGANPIHFYADASYSECGCFVPSNEISGFTVEGTDTVTPSGALGIGLGDYGEDDYVTITATGQIPSTGLVYVTIHLDYGLKGTVGYQKNWNDDAIDPDTYEVLVPNLDDYKFSYEGTSINSTIKDAQTVQNENTFKRNPGFGGIVTDEFGTPIEGYIVRVYDSDGNLIGETVTDEDGYWFIYYKHKGRRAWFKVAVFENSDDTEPLAEQWVLLKANKFAEVNFEIE
ncbi:MAG: DUF11 domain-containing protein, partial [Methanomassiliicoccales archaeon]